MPTLKKKVAAAPVLVTASAPAIPATAPTALNVKQAATRRNKAKEASLKMCNELWPAVTDAELWLQEDRSKKGFLWMPRPMPLFINLINDISKKVTGGKAVPAGKSYLVLWCRIRDGAFLDIEHEVVAALARAFECPSVARLHRLQAGAGRADAICIALESLSRREEVKGQRVYPGSGLHRDF